MRNIKLLDCTLRDGGHVVKGKFGEHTIKSIIKDLVNARIDIIEIGFLWGEDTDEDTARFDNIDKVRKYLPKDMGNTLVSLMADNIDLSNLQPYDGTVEIIRLSFRKNELEWVKKAARIVMDKGYKVYINPIHGSAISDMEYLKIIQMVNELKPYGFAIVDTFGAMRKRDLGRIYSLIENNLDPEIELGIHLHENLGLAYSLAQHILEIVSPKRKIVIDGSLYGMGKIPGNLCIEQMIDFLNNDYGYNYVTEPVYDAIDQFIMPFYIKYRWGYSIPYALSAQCGVHRTYAEFLNSKGRLTTKDMRRLLSMVEDNKSEIFDESYIENLYKNYMNASFDDSTYLNRLKEKLRDKRQIIIIAPGASVNSYELEDNLIKNSYVITVNLDYTKVKTDLNFYSNAKRLVYAKNLDSSKIIITSNLIEEIPDAKYIVSRNELIYHDDNWSDDSTLMLLNLLKRIGCKDIYIAGFDGFIKKEQNFYDNIYEGTIRDYDFDIQSRMIILKKVYSSMDIHFLTPSVYETFMN